MAKSDALIVEIIEDELYSANEEMEQHSKNLDDESSEYSDISSMTDHLGGETERLVRDQKLPEKEVIGQVSTTDMVIDLALANIAKQTSIKLQKFEKFLGKIEDQLFKDSTLQEMTKSDLLTLYTSTRMMRTDAFRMLKEIRKDVDFSNLEASLLSLHSKESMRESEHHGNKMKGLLETLLTNADFLDQAAAHQRANMMKEDESEKEKED